jgi:hypothetical protein
MYTRTDVRVATTIVLMLVKTDRFTVQVSSDGGHVLYLGLVVQAASDPILSVPDRYSIYIPS